jgi:hypothetical protein
MGVTGAQKESECKFTKHSYRILKSKGEKNKQQTTMYEQGGVSRVRKKRVDVNFKHGSRQPEGITKIK